MTHPLIQLTHIVSYPLGLLVLGWAAWPLCRRQFAPSPDRGWAYVKIFGLALAGGLSWVLCALDLAAFSALGIWSSVFLLAGVGWMASRRDGKGFCSLPEISRSYLIVSESVFILFYLAALYVRLCNPDIAHTEQPMDLTMMQSLWQSGSFPPDDLWLPGYPVSYYYLGYWLQLIPARLFGCPPNLAYNIGLAAWFALLVQGLAGLGYNLLKRFEFSVQTALPGGLFMAFFTLLSSNVAGLLAAVSSDGHHWWWWGASRAVKDGSVELITEFPFFSFLLGDNHPHLLVLPLLALFLALALNALYRACEKDGRSMGKIFLDDLLPLALLAGLIHAANGWNTPACVLLAAMVVWEFPFSWKRRMPLIALWLAAVFLVIAILFYPYQLTAQNQLRGLSFFHGIHTTLHDFTAHFGLMFPGILALLALAAQRRFSQPGFPAMRFALCLALAGLVCALVPEWVIFLDVFNNRMNTLFKFYYQAWIYLSLAASFALAAAWRVPRMRVASILFCLAALAGLAYPARALYSVTNRFTPSSNGLDGAAWVAQADPDLADALAWIEENTPADRLFLAPAGEGYQPLSSAVATFAGRPVVLGWIGHEQQWRGDLFTRMAGDREQMCGQFYQQAQLRAWLDSALRPRIRYIFTSHHKHGAISELLAASPHVRRIYTNRSYSLYETN